MSLLALSDICAGYGEVDIVSGLSLTVEPGEIVTIAGTNGAGKSTLVKSIMGLAPRCRGGLTFDGHDLMKYKPEDRIRLGISYVPQVANVFASLTVLENLLVVEHVKNRSARLDEVFSLFPMLKERRSVKAGNLSGGERQRVAFARALMPAPKLLLLDEPTASLAPSTVEDVFHLIAGLPKLGVAALVVEQRARQSLEISARGYILDTGRIVLADDARKLLADERMMELYLGRG